MSDLSHAGHFVRELQAVEKGSGRAPAVGTLQAADSCGSPLADILAAALLDEIADAVMVCDADARPAMLNFAARRELHAAHYLHLDSGGVLATRDTQTTQRLRTAIREAPRSGRREMISLRAEDSRLFLVVLPLRIGSSPTNFTIVLCGGRQICPDLAVEMLSALHGLTVSERRVLAGLLAGHRPIEVADANGVEVSTIRSQVGTIRSKLGVRSISELTQLAARLPAVVTAIRSLPCAVAI